MDEDLTLSDRLPSVDTSVSAAVVAPAASSSSGGRPAGGAERLRGPGVAEAERHEPSVPDLNISGGALNSLRH